MNHLSLLNNFFYAIFILLTISGCTNNEGNRYHITNNYNKEAITYFTQVGFNEKGTLKKWQNDMTVSVIGKYDRNDLKSIDEFIKVFNGLSGNIKMKRKENGGNIIINFGEDKMFNPKGYVGLCSARSPFFFSNEISSAKILIAPILGAKQKRRTIHHELLHAIGLKHAIGLDGVKTEYKSYNMMGVNGYESIDDYEKQTQDIQNSELDKWAISILYDSSIKPGLKKSDFIKSIKK